MSRPQAQRENIHRIEGGREGEGRVRRTEVASKIQVINQNVNDKLSSSSSDSEAESIRQGDLIEETSSSGTSDSDEDMPNMTTEKSAPDPDIHKRLTSFFSQLAAQRANPQLEADEIIERGSESDSGYEEDEEGRQYVELDLALGVLSEGDGEGGDIEDVKLPIRAQSGQENSEISDSEVREPLHILKSIVEQGSESRQMRKSRTTKRKIEEVG